MRLRRVAILLIPGIWQTRLPQQPDRSSRLTTELRLFADSFFESAVDRHQIPGAVLVVVKDGKVLLSKGYGFANLERHTPMDPERSVLRVASVSKLFTAVAVMQQVERGKLRLDQDVNTYLTDLKIPTPFGRPVTVADLLTHSGGFDERLLGTVASSDSTKLALGQYLATHMPPPIRPPGELVAYSNHGIALAGHLVEEVTGVPFVQYMNQDVFAPLGMSYSTFGPIMVSDSLRAIEYTWELDHFQPVIIPRRLIQIAPAAGMITTGADMGRFMIAVLDGKNSQHPLLRPSTLDLMRERHLGNDPRLPGATYGSFEHFENGLRGLVNDGDWMGHANRVFLVPEERLGVFLSVNTSDGRIRQEFISQVLDRLYPDPSFKRPLRTTLPVDLDRFAGRYRSIAIPHRTIDKIAELTQLVVNVEPDRTLRLSGMQYNGSTLVRFYPVDSLVFAPTQGEGLLVFRADRRGRITHAFIGTTDAEITGTTVMERMPGYGAIKIQVALLAFLIFCPLTVLWWPTDWIIQRVRGRRKAQSSAAIWARRWAAAVSLLIVTFLIILLAPVLRSMVTNRLEGGDVTPGMKLLFVLPMITVLLALVLPYFSLRSWKEGYWSFLGRVHYSLLTIAGVLYIPFLIHWNMLGYNF
jgi:CubicO group peptidase (beta-lactamase class C family)